MNFKLPVTPEILAEVSTFDRFQGRWSAQQIIPKDRLERLREAALVRAVGSSCRLAGIRVIDADVAGLIRGDAVQLSDAEEVLGYARALNRPPADAERLLEGKDLQELHALMMGKPEQPSPWRTQALHREAFDADGKATGQVFATLPPRLIPKTTASCLTWLEYELREKEQHPVLVIGALVLAVLSISPFERGNGRLARMLANRLLLRSGYGAMPYASLESQIETLREDHNAAILQAQTKLWTGEADLTPWLVFFLQVLGLHRRRVEAKIDLERKVQDFPPLQQAILETVREHGSVDAALLINATGANRNTLKDNLRRLVQRGLLEKSGQRRGTRYRMATGEELLSVPGEGLGH